MDFSNPCNLCNLWIRKIFENEARFVVGAKPLLDAVVNDFMLPGIKA